MSKHTKLWISLILGTWGLFIQSATLPLNISATEFDKLNEILGYGNVTRVMRSAESYPTFPGFKVGLEITMTPSRSLNTFGDASGSAPSVILAPRIYMAKGLGADLEVMFAFFSPGISKTMSTFGALGKWTFYDEKENFVSAAAYLSYTGLTGFNETYKGTDVEAGVYFSRDYVSLKPYLGAALLFANANVPLSVSPLKTSGWQSTVHFFLGLEYELPVNFTVQLDLMNLVPMGSVGLGYKF